MLDTQPERERMASWYTSEFESAGNLASETESSASADVGGVRLALSDESQGAVPKLGTSARVTGEVREKIRVRFALNPRIVPDAWFQLLSEDVRFASKE